MNTPAVDLSAVPQFTKKLLTSEPYFTFERIAKFKPHAVVTYGKFTSTTPSTQTNEKSLQNLEKVNEEGYNGYMSDATRRNVKGIIENLLTAIELNTSMKFPFVKGQEKPMDVVYPTFVTLTLPAKQMHCDNDVKRDIFTPFMQEMIRNWNVKCYVWVAETQKNGNLHFHILMDRAVPALRLRQIWNKHCNTMPYEYVNCYTRWQRAVYKKGYFFREEMFDKRVIKERERAKAEGKRLNAKDIAIIKDKEKKRQVEVFKKQIKDGFRVDKVKLKKAVLAVMELPENEGENWEAADIQEIEKQETERQRAYYMKYVGEGKYVFNEDDYYAAVAAETARKGRELTQKECWDIEDKEEARQKTLFQDLSSEWWKDPNSTDIHSIQNIKKLTAYVTKYFTKAPEIVKPPLAQNQELIHEGGKYYIQTNHVVENPGWDEPSIIPERVEHKPVFTTRKITGRVWGAAERLKAPDTKPCPYAIAIKTYTQAWNTYQINSHRPQTFRVLKNVDLFGNEEYEYETRNIEHNYTKMEERKWFSNNKDAESYLEVLQSFVPLEDIKAATAKAGALFASSESNMVIPLREPQKDYLKQYSPGLWDGYQAHYRTVFQTLYNEQPTAKAA